MKTNIPFSVRFKNAKQREKFARKQFIMNTLASFGLTTIVAMIIYSIKFGFFHQYFIGGESLLLLVFAAFVFYCMDEDSERYYGK